MVWYSRVTADTASAFEVLAAAIQLRPRRIVYMGVPTVSRSVGASDAAYENKSGTGGYLVVEKRYTRKESRGGEGWYTSQMQSTSSGRSSIHA